MTVTLVFQCLRGFVLKLQLLLHVAVAVDFSWRRCLSFQPWTHGAVGQLSLVANQRPVDFARSKGPLFVDHVLHHDRQAVLVLQQGTGAGGKLLGQHRKNSNAGVNRGRLFRCVQINRRIACCEYIDVSDPYHHLRIAAEILGDLDLVEVLGRVVVNRGPGEIAQIANFVAGRELWRVRIQLVQLLLDFGRKLRLEPVLDHRLAREVPEINVMVVVHSET